MRKIIFTLFLLLICQNLAAGQSAPRKLALLVVQCKAGEGACYTQEIVRYNFIDGEFASKETLLSIPTKDFRFDLGGNSIYRNRYVLGSSGFFDIETRKLLGDGRGQLVETAGDDLVVEVSRIDMEGFFAFNLQTKEYRKLPPGNVFELEGETYPDRPGKLSPGKSRFAYWKKSGLGAELAFFNVIDWRGVAIKTVKGSFYASCSYRCSGGAEPSFVWLDDENILTQKSNGEIVKININGKIEPVAKIKIDEDPDSLPWFDKDTYGNVSYYLNGTIYLIDAKNKKYKKEMAVLGNGFESVDGEVFWTEYFYQKKSIGLVWSSGPLTYKGFLVIDYAKEGQNLGSVDGIKVWNDIKKDWITIEIDWGVKTIGWIED